MKNNKILLSIAAFTLLLHGCNKGLDPTPKPEPGPQPEKKEVSKPSVTNIQIKSVSVSATTIVAPADIEQKGFVYSTRENPTFSDKRVQCADSFSAEISGLDAYTTYYIKAYVYTKTKKEFFYSDQTTFTTLASGDLNDYKAPAYVDDYRNIAGWNDRFKWNLANVHDPTVFLADDGYYYMYQTDASFGNAHEAGGHFHGRRSKNLIDWEYLGGTMKATPAWVLEKSNEYRTKLGLAKITQPVYGWWAPCARKVTVGGKTIYRMYYSIIMDNYIGNGKPVSTAFDGTWTERAFIGLMETENPADNNSWVDKGFVICSSSDKDRNWSRASQGDWNAYFKFNAIDPSYIVTPSGEHWLIYGSWHSGIAAVQLDPATGKTKTALPDPWGNTNDIAPYGKNIESRGGRWQGSEGPEVVYRNGYYYLFLAYDGLDIPYNTRVVRSEKIDGPYKDINGASANGLADAYPIQTHPYKFAGIGSSGWGWVGVSHCAVWDDGKGNWYFASQGRFPNEASGASPNAVMMGHVRSIIWSEEGWPMVLPERYGAVPQVAISQSEIAGTWEHIDLSYSKNRQQASSEMVFAADGKITSGAWKGSTWTFNAEKRTLQISNGVKLYLARECDWEAAPRKHTIVYVAHGANKTYWGKKK